MLTDSGGFQVCSLGEMRKISEEGVTFVSPVSGDKLLLTPEVSVQMHTVLNADIAMQFDECTPNQTGGSITSEAQAQASMALSLRWARRSRDEFLRLEYPNAPFGIVRDLQLHSPPYAAGWSAMMKRMRGDVELPPLMAELAMCSVATLNRSDYQYHHHAIRFLTVGGSAAQLVSIRMLPDVAGSGSVFDATQRAVLALAVQMTCNVTVTEAVFEEARRQLGSDRLMMEAVGIIDAHNMVSRVLVACEVGIES